ncbi:MAG: DUF2162 domain-containing protein [Deltaproteobacteria bacterium]|nr:DUF2162 domain-containing protein [Deltaproteobacteria bacterium]
MELKTLWLGLVISLGAFAVKTGLGWAYALAVGRLRQRLLASLAVIFCYAALFGLVFLVISKINLLAHYETLLPLWRHGFLLHWLTALMLLAWGLILLGRGADASCGAAPSRGWLALVIPCPVCLSVILMSAAVLNLYFPEQAPAAIAALFLAFMTIAALAAFLARAGACAVRPASAGTNSAPLEANLGLTMLLVALYFMLSALISPQFAELGRVYRISAYPAGGQDAQLGPRLFTLGAIGLVFITGFLAAKKRCGKQR